MAQKKAPQKNNRTTSRQPASRQQASRQNGRSTSTAPSKRRTPAPVSEEPDDSPSILSVLWASHWGKLLYALLGTLLLIAIDFLVSMNHYDSFFTILGVEIVIVMVIGWIVFLVFGRKQHDLSTSYEDESDVE